VNRWWPVALGVGGLALLAFSARPSTVAPFRRKTMNYATRAITWVAQTESRGNYGAQNKNLDGAGLSYGLIQWTQKSGSLGKLLQAMQARDPTAFETVFAPDAARLLAVTTSPYPAVRMSLALWTAPWTSRFDAAGRHPPFQEAQLQAAAASDHWLAAVSVAEILGVWTERAAVLFFDRCVQQGPVQTPKIATRLRDALLAQGRTEVPYYDLLRAFAARCAAPYRRRTQPTELVTPSGKEWRQVGDEWHQFAGTFDLYATIVARSGAILADPSLADVDTRMAVA
jgi:hypothetical protein